MDTPDVRRLFSACDANKSGRIEYEDFTLVCRELHVPSSEMRTLFQKFDVDGDGCINYNDFCLNFHEVSEMTDFSSLQSHSHSRTSAWEEFENTLDGDVAYYLGRQEHLLNNCTIIIFGYYNDKKQYNVTTLYVLFCPILTSWKIKYLS